ncbi:hypothetical protein PMIN06_010598 [Paraphaeosphaeria minitans]
MVGQSSLTLWYSVAACALVIFLALRWLTYYVSRCVTTWSTYVILKYLQYTEIKLLRRLRLRTTIGDVILYIVLLSANVICISWKVQSLTDFNTRTASMLSTNLVLLLPSADTIADMIVQSILHPCLAAYNSGLLWNVRFITGITINPARPWKVHPGQYVYLTVAKAGMLSRFQRHPFMVASPVLSNSIELHVWPQKGFTKRLLRLSEQYQYCEAWIEGPYGRSIDLREFGTVVIIASEMGITGHLAYLRDLVQKQDDFNTKIRDVVFIWSIEEWSDAHPARKSMDELLKKDKERETARSSLTKDQRYLHSKEEDRQEDPGVRPVLSGNNLLDIYVYVRKFP